MEDLQSTTRYVTWSLHTKSRSSLKAMLSKVTAPGQGQGGQGHGGAQLSGKGGGEAPSGATADFLESTLWNRTLGPTSEEIVAALVCQIFEGAPPRAASWAAGGGRQGVPPGCAPPLPRQPCRCGAAARRALPAARGARQGVGASLRRLRAVPPPPRPPPPPAAPPVAGIRDHFVQSVELKFNCFFLMPIIDTFPTRLREELESAYEEDLDEVGARWGVAIPRLLACWLWCLEGAYEGELGRGGWVLAGGCWFRGLRLARCLGTDAWQLWVAAVHARRACRPPRHPTPPAPAHPGL